MDNTDPHVDNSAWVFDSLVGFLHGPIWNAPLQTFIEEKSLPFEPTESGEVRDQPEYKQIFDEYRNMVDMMLGTFMEDIGITPEQFEAACRRSRQELHGLPAPFHRRLFEQVWAANDYATFTKMMTHRNVELQLQALELIEREFGAMPNIYLSDELEYPGSPQPGDDEWPDKQNIMAQIEKLQLSDGSDNDDDVVEAPPPPPPPAPERIKVDVAAEKKILRSKLVSFAVNISEEPAPPPPSPVAAAADSSEPSQGHTDRAPTKREVSEEEVRKRQEYLMRQRDKLLARKRQARERELLATGGAGGASGEDAGAARPASARAARALLAGATPPAPAPSPGDPDDASLQLRRALADRLKAEVVDGQR